MPPKLTEKDGKKLAGASVQNEGRPIVRVGQRGFWVRRETLSGSAGSYTTFLFFIAFNRRRATGFVSRFGRDPAVKQIELRLAQQL